ncbi:site-specific integrase [Roseovarius nubinhibens]|uniref:site-specific integrase n=1 Tax=Roseovarius nubinhibens TaxID=314263 RepID=UPI0030ED88B8|tara:strand:- start:2752 stop:4422 length:1671 start_codon:yes stop_codon:yes gene_type:complete
MPLDQAKPRTLADIIILLETDASAASTRTRHRISAINRFCDLVHRAPGDVSTDAPSLRGLLDGIHPAQYCITAKTLSNIKSALADALRTVGSLPKDDPKGARSKAWVEFLDHAGAKHQAWSLSRLVTYCSNRRIEPDAVSDDVMGAFQSHLDARLLTKDPATLCKEMAQTWNGIVKRNNLPFAALSYEVGGQYRCRPLSIYPQSLQDEISRYLDLLAHDDLFDKDGPDKPLRPTSLRNTEAHLRQYLDGMVLAGEEPAKLTHLKKVVTTEKMKLAFKAIIERRGNNEIPVGLHNIAATITGLARHYLKVDPAELDGIRNIKKKVFSDPSGMSDKNSERLAQFNDWGNVARLISLPCQLMARALDNPASNRSALLAMHAAAFSILLSCPMRAKNLASLDLERHILTHRKGTHTIYTLRIAGREVKNKEPIEVQLNPGNSRLLHTYITTFRPQISSVLGSALFPKTGDGTPRAPSNLSSDLKYLIYRETGLVVNVHLFRHIAAKLYLNAHPGDYETVRRLLKHKKLQTTIDFYAELSNQWAHDRYDVAVLSKWGGGND